MAKPQARSHTMRISAHQTGSKAGLMGSNFSWACSKTTLQIFT